MLRDMYDKSKAVFGTSLCPLKASWAVPSEYETDPVNGYISLQWCDNALEDLYDSLGIEEVFDLKGTAKQYTEEEKQKYEEENPDSPPLPDDEYLKYF